MELTDFKSLLTSFAQRPVPPLAGRHLYLWHGELAPLQGITPPGLGVGLDLMELAQSVPRTPTAVDEARRVLQTALHAWLESHAPPANAQQMVVVTGAALLARYRMPLTAFFTWAGDSQMFVFVLPPHETTLRAPRPLPPYVDFNPRATLDYLRTNLGDRATIGDAAQ